MLGERVRRLCSHNRCAGFAQRSGRVAWPVSLDENARRKSAGKKEIPLSPIAIEIVRRIDALFEIERAINGNSAAESLTVRHKELWLILGDGVNQAADWISDATSIPSLKFTPLTTFGN